METETIIPEVVPDVDVVPMRVPQKLSDFMRLGASLTGPTKGALFEDRHGVLHTCALGAAYEGLRNTYGLESMSYGMEGTVSPSWERMTELGTYEFLQYEGQVLPAILDLLAKGRITKERFDVVRHALGDRANTTGYTVGNVPKLLGEVEIADFIVALNDSGHLSREEIADVLEGMGY